MVKKRERSSAEAFIQGAELHQGPVVEEVAAPKPKESAAKFKRLTFSLSDDADVAIDRLSLTPRNFRCNRSDVIRAAIQALDNLPEAEQIKLLRDGKHRQ